MQLWDHLQKVKLRAPALVAEGSLDHILLKVLVNIHRLVESKVHDTAKVRLGVEAELFEHTYISIELPVRLETKANIRAERTAV